MRLTVLLITSIICSLIFQGCKEEVVTTDIFVLEEPSVDNLTSVDLQGMGTLYVNSDRINMEDGVAQIKGTLYSRVEEEFVAFISSLPKA